MKKLFFYFLFFFFFIKCNSQNYIDNYKGSFPVIITSSHGGNIYKGLEKRDCNNNNCSKDLYTKEITLMLYEELNSLNINSSYVINNIHRKVLDCNREKNVAYIDDVAKKNYYKFHSKIEQYITDNIFSDSITLILDIHGHTHKHNYLELGYDISYEKLNKDVFEIYNSSLQNISNEKSLLAILGDIYRLKSNIIAVPNSNIDTPKEYFNGGYITEKYKLYPNTVVIQLEIPSLIRKNKNLRKEFCKVTSTIIKDYYSFLNYIYEKN